MATYLTGGRFTPARIDATTDRLEFPQQGWALRPAMERVSPTRRRGP